MDQELTYSKSIKKKTSKLAQGKRIEIQILYRYYRTNGEWVTGKIAKRPVRILKPICLWGLWDRRDQFLNQYVVKE